ncbi:CHROMATIN REMODELING 5 protein [Nymphaea thermarum]|nr:CHROMATIN REMODELING 5 protein [Nymphaea thermarum]
MAFYRKYTNGRESTRQLLEEKKLDLNRESNEDFPGHSGNDETGASSSEKDADGKADDEYQSEEDVLEVARPENGFVKNEFGGTQNSQPLGRKTALVGTWGSSLWKDFQAPLSREGSEVERDSKYVDSSYKAEDGFENNISDGTSDHLDMEDFDTSKDQEDSQKGPVDIPADEMSSDDYYEQDGEEQSEQFHYRGTSDASKAGSLAKSVTIKKRASRSSVATDSDYGDDDYDEDDDCNEEDGDDPEDADFDPNYDGDQGGGTRQELSSDDFDEGEEKDGDFDMLEEIDEEAFEFGSNKKRKKKTKSKSSKGAKPFPVAARQKRRAAYSEEEDSSAEDSEEDSDEDFDLGKRQASHLRKKNGNCSSVPENSLSHCRELRTSRRPVRKVSYAESEESEDTNEDKVKKSQKVSPEEAEEEEDGDAIEKVLWHQSKGVAHDALANGRSSLPVVSNFLLDSELDWENVEFFIKWKGQSYMHCQWQPLSELQNLSGFKKVLNYMKRVKEERNFRKALSREEVEVHDVNKEMELDLLKQEKDTEIAFAQDAIDEYKAREAAMTVVGKTVDSQRKKSRASLRKLDQQPDWLRGGKLRDYQLEGLNFLVNSWRNDTNVILADEMGLGKTVQSVSMLGFLQYTQQIHGPFLVVVPLSTITNWAREFRRWLPDMNVVMYVGNRASRETCQQYEFYTDKKSGRNIKFNALLTTYEVVLKDKAVFSKIKWNYLMVDEAHRLKNSEASLYTTLSELSTKNKLLITGTPLQNSVEELWALLHFLEPEKFKNKEMFVERYKNLSSFDEIELASLHKELRPHLLRRVIKDVEKSLPPKIERILRVEMTPLQKQYYKWILERNFHDLNKGVRGNQVSLLNIVVELKKCCNHPFLFESADHGYGGDGNLNDSCKVQRIIMSSGKLVILDKLLIRLRETKHRVLIFSQMVRMLDILAEYLSLRGFQFQRLDGSTRADLRHQAMDHFNAPGSEDFCFLLSTRAGGLGINLATADTVIIVDSDWNPQNDLQAMSRAHRIGQQEVVNIYRFVTSKSVEEDILERAKKKMVLDHLVIQKLNTEGRLEKKEAKKGSAMFDKNELSAILRFGAEELFKEDKNDEEHKRKLENMDIDEILERAEKVANFCNAEDDVSFWSRLIQPEAVTQAEDALAPRAARSNKSYVESEQAERTVKRKKRGSDLNEKLPRRNTRASDASTQVPAIEGAAAHVRDWFGGNISKKDANAFVRAVKKFGDSSRIDSIVAEVGGGIESASPDAQTGLFELLMDGCKEVSRWKNENKGMLLDFFGVPVKAQELLDRVQELQLLAKRIKRYQDPFAQFRLKTHPRDPPWSKSCGWNQVDDARLLLGIHIHGYGNWEKIRLDSRLGLTSKIAPAGLTASATLLPRPPSLDARASALLRKEFEIVSGKNLKMDLTSKSSKGEKASLLNVSFLGVKGKSGAVKSKTHKDNKAEPRVKEEGEISESEDLERYRRYKEKIDQETKEEKWREWCADVMSDELRTLRRLQKLQTTSENLPKAEVLSKVRKYLQVLGHKIDLIVQEHAKSHKNYTRMSTRLWNYVAGFSNLPGDRLSQIYSKLKQERPSEAMVPSQHFGGTAPGPSGRDDAGMCAPFIDRAYQKSMGFTGNAFHRDQETGKSEAWKRRRRNDFQPDFQYAAYRQPFNNPNRLSDPSAAGILGSAPGDIRRFANERWKKPQQQQPPMGNEQEFQ